MNHTITLNTVRYFKRIMRPLAEDGIIPLPEYHEAISQLTSLAEHGTLKPAVIQTQDGGILRSVQEYGHNRLHCLIRR